VKRINWPLVAAIIAMLFCLVYMYTHSWGR
jgi:hypothetical protein